MEPEALKFLICFAVVCFQIFPVTVCEDTTDIQSSGYESLEESAEIECESICNTTASQEACKGSCNATVKADICATDGKLYDECEFEKAKCRGEAIAVQNYGSSCTTQPPHDLNAKCSKHKMPEDCSSAICSTNSLTEISRCYESRCYFDLQNHTYLYSEIQCSSLCENWCWCSTPQGEPITGTLMHVQAGHDEITCKDVLNLKPKILCEYNGENYTDGATIPKYPVCGFCKCFNGNVICYKDFIPDDEGNLSAAQLKLLKKTVLYLFSYQYEHEMFDIDLSTIRHQNITELSDSTKRTVLEKKFEAYDIFKDNQLSNIEQHHFMEELFQFVKCHTFREQISDIFGSHLDLNMWIEFFDYDHMEDETARKRRNLLKQKRSLKLGRKLTYIWL